MFSSKPVLMPPSPNVQRKQSRLNRLSSFFPSLISPQSPEPATGPSVHRKPIPEDSPINGKSPILTDWESHVRSRLDPVQPESPSSPGGSLFLDAQQRLKQQHSGDPAPAKMKLQKQPASHAPPPVLDKPAPPLPTRASDLTSPPGSEFQSEETKPSTKLTKRPTGHRLRSSSHDGTQKSPPPMSALAHRHPSPSAEPRGRSASAQPPRKRIDSTPGIRNITAAARLESRPGSSNGSQSPTRDGEKRGRLRRSWFPGNSSRSNSQDIRGGAQTSGAWTLGQTKADYNASFLASGERVPELWNEGGSVLVYLHAKGSGLGPSFKVPSFITDYSLVFNDLIDAELTSPSSSGRPRARSFTGRDSLSVADAERRPRDSPPLSPPVSGDQESGESKLYLPAPPSDQIQGAAPQPDLDRLISIRNLFAFLTGQPLVGTKGLPTVFAALMRVSSLLAEFEFTNTDGSTFGDAVEMSCAFFMDQMAVADVRHSREKTLEALVLGERMRSWDLYNEAFAHAVGKYSAIRDLNSPLWEQVSSLTRQRLERGHLDLLNRQNSINNRLESFEFPSLFSGIANSATLFKNVKFGIWRKSFLRMRSFVLGYYKNEFGSWPPKARSKKNPFSESGLNRQVLKILYSDLCVLYDAIADRESITPRAIDESDTEDDASGNQDIAALRRILTEYDMSSPPVLPPIPYDIPRAPGLTSVKENYHDLPAKEQARLDKNYQDYEFQIILTKSYDFETLKLKIPFLEEFAAWEKREAKGKPVSEIADQRIGYWLFLYVVIQALPILVVDAPGLKFTEGVEYFLCQPPKGSPPWLEGAAEVRKRWYEVSGGAGYVELSEDTIEFSVEGIYHRSHCWVAAKNWAAGLGGPAPSQDRLPPLQAPQSVFADSNLSLSLSPKLTDRSESPVSTVSPGLALRPRGASPGGRQGYRSSIALGLEPVPMDAHPGDPRGSRFFSARDGPSNSRPSSAAMGRSRSSGNLHGMAMASAVGHASDSRASSRQGSQGGSTFDDILKDMNSKPKEKKKSFFG
ncbi:hypothetical protein BJ170DRAFT_677176 [Xylariales sp. AK1849]|nr:hypothetical protein BJ170DRAFT_677176 [Xylariales sp. AK1849]